MAELLTSALLTRRRDLVTSRRGDVATWQPLLALLCIALKKFTSDNRFFHSTVPATTPDTKIRDLTTKTIEFL